MAKSKSAKSVAPPLAEYTVVARRYRPQQFADLIGQEHVAAALVNALESGRVSHAYLFTGARGVGKTSAARILAKALNCVKGPTATPCDECDSCKAVAAGEDVDVSEIDGASNNKVEEVRDLRQNVGFRPTRGRYKIYIIDEVHMLSTAAFNALLKTLEEPPPHVKFILATTEVQKIPITILSRCQRFDFALVGPRKIFEQLKRIVEKEGLRADDEALTAIARRAGGSMRDSQSLLDQLLASSSDKLTLERVIATLGTSGDDRVTTLAAAILAHDPKTALEFIANESERGLQIGELIDQLIAFWRSLMLVNCGGPEVRDLPIGPLQKPIITAHAQQLSLDLILAGLDVWTAVKSRIRDTAHARVLLEMAVIRLARMDELLSVGQLIAAVREGSGSVNGIPSAAQPGPVGDVKKNGQLRAEEAIAGPSPSGSESALELSESTLPELWRGLIHYLGEKSPILSSHLKLANSPAIFGPNSLAITFPVRYNHARDACANLGNTERIERALGLLTGKPVRVRFDLTTRENADAEVSEPGPAATDPKKQLMSMPLFQKAGQVLGAQIWHVDSEFNPVAPPRPDSIPELDPDET